MKIVLSTSYISLHTTKEYLNVVVYFNNSAMIRSRGR